MSLYSPTSSIARMLQSSVFMSRNQVKNGVEKGQATIDQLIWLRFAQTIRDGVFDQYNDRWADYFKKQENKTKIVMLDLGRLGLEKIPETVLLLVALHTLSLSENSFSTLSQLSNLQNLERLDLSNNCLRDLSPILSLPKLKELKLKNNQLTQLPNLSNLLGLEKIDLSQNRLVNIEPLFQVTTLTEIDCDQNQITTISRKIKKLVSLSVLSLCENQLTKVPETVFVLGLRVLRLSGNPINESPRSFSKLQYLTDVELARMPSAFFSDPSLLIGITSNPALKRLDLEHNGLIGTLDVSCLKNLEVLEVRGNQLTQIIGLEKLKLLRRPYFSGNPFKTTPEFGNRIEDVELEENNLTVFPKSLQKVQRSLVRLKLSKNRFTKVPVVFWSCFPNLTQLSLSGALLSKLPNEISNLRSLTVLQLKDNNLQELPESLKRLKLRILNISRNYFSVFPRVIFSLENLEQLDVSNNQIAEFPDPRVFESLTRLKFFSIDNNPINYPNTFYRILSTQIAVMKFSLRPNLKHWNEEDIEERSGEDLNNFPIDLSTNLVELNLSNNKKLRSLPQNFFSRFNKLQSLDLSRTCVTTLPKQGVTSPIKVLKYNGNKGFPQVGFSHLQELYLRECNLKELPKNLHRSFPKLRCLDLAYNQLKGDLRSSLDHLNLIFLNLDGNNFTDVPDLSYLPLLSLNLSIKNLAVGQRSSLLDPASENCLDQYKFMPRLVMLPLEKLSAERSISLNRLLDLGFKREELNKLKIIELVANHNYISLRHLVKGIRAVYFDGVKSSLSKSELIMLIDKFSRVFFFNDQHRFPILKEIDISKLPKTLQKLTMENLTFDSLVGLNNLRNLSHLAIRTSSTFKKILMLPQGIDRLPLLTDLYIDKRLALRLPAKMLRRPKLKINSQKAIKFLRNGNQTKNRPIVIYNTLMHLDGKERKHFEKKNSDH